MYSDWSFAWFSSAHPSKFRDTFLIDHDHFFPKSFPIHLSSYTVSVVKKIRLYECVKERMDALVRLHLFSTDTEICCPCPLNPCELLAPLKHPSEDVYVTAVTDYNSLNTS